MADNLKIQLNKRFDVAEEISTISNLIQNRLDLILEGEILNSVSKKLKEDKFQVLIMGEFSTGKSTLLNALLGEQALPMKTTPATAIITRIRYGEKPKVELFYRNGDKENYSIDDFRARFQLDENDAEATGRIVTDRFINISHAVVHYPIELCKNNIELIDSPGLNDSSVRTRTTYQFLPNADAVIFLSSALQFYSDKESAYLEEDLKPRGLKNIFFGITKWDLVDQSSLEPEKEKRDLIDRARKVLEPFYTINGINLFNRRVHTINSFAALKAKKRNPIDNELYSQSGLDSFEVELKLFLENEKGAVLLDRALAESKNAVKIASAKIDEMLSALDQELDVLKKKEAEQKPRLDRMKRIILDAEEKIEEQIQKQEETVVLSLFRFTDDLKERLRVDIKDFETTKRIGIINLITNRRSLELGYTSDFETYFRREYGEWGDAISQQMMYSFRQLDRSLGRDVDEFLDLSRNITASFSGVPLVEMPIKAKDEDEGALQKLAATSVGILTLDPSGLLAGAMGVGGWSGILTRLVKDVIIFKVLAALFTGGALFIVYLISKAIQSFFDVKQKKDQLSDFVADKMAAELPGKIRSQELEIKSSVREFFSEYKTKVMEVLSSKVEEHEVFMRKIIQEKEIKGDSVKETKKELEELRIDLQAKVTKIEHTI